jgi:hypothetical protein
MMIDSAPRPARASARRFSAVLTYVLLLVLLSGCMRAERTIKVSDDWSRGQRLEYASLLQPAALAAEPDGQVVHVAWSGRVEEGQDTELFYAQLDGEGEKRLQRVLPFLFLPRHPQLVLASDSHVHLFTRARRSASSEDGLFYMLLDREGSPAGEGLQLSQVGHEALSYAVAANRSGSVEVFWAEDQGESIWLYHQRLGSDGVAQTNAERVAAGEEPTAQVDNEGTIHLAWLSPSGGRSRLLRYAAFPQGEVSANPGIQIGDLPASGVGVRRPISLGLDERHVYVFWSMEWRSGLSAGNADSPYVHFPLGRPHDALGSDVRVPLDAEAYDALVNPVREAEAYRLDGLLLALPSSMGRTSAFVEAPRVVPGQRSELAVLLDARVEFRHSDDNQTILTLYKHGQMVAYDMAARTASLSQWPSAVADERGELHLVWVDYDTSSGHSVYYASTAPSVRANLDRRTRQDLLLGSAEAAWGVLSGLSLLPLVVMLMLPVVIWCGIFYIFGSDDSLEERGPRIGFIVAMLIYFPGKLAVMAPVLMLPPGLTMVPGWLRGAWPVLMVIAVAAISALIFWRIYWRRSERKALFPAVLWFTLTDSVLTLLLYGMAFFGD